MYSRVVDDVERITRAVFKLLAHRVSEGEIEHIKEVLPEELVSLWPVKM
jgi:uncharacterized protein (DUF2267 family)